jgi:hypothetical protein
VKRIDFTGAVTEQDSGEFDWVPAPSIAATSSDAEDKNSETSSESDDASGVSSEESMESSQIVVVDQDEWFVQSEPAAEHLQSMPTNETQEDKSRLQIPFGLEKAPSIRDERDAEHPHFMPTNDAQDDTSRLQVPIGLEKAPSIRDDSESRINSPADEKRNIIHSSSGRLRFDMTPETIYIDSDIEKATTKKKRNKDHGMPKKVYGTTLGYLMLCIFVVIIPAGVTSLVLLVFNKDDNGGGADPNDLGMNSTSATLEPGTSPNEPPSSERPPFESPSMPIGGDQSKPPAQTPPVLPPQVPTPSEPSNPTTGPPPSAFDPTSDVLVALLSTVSADEGAALRDPTSPQFAAMQWIRSPNNAGIYNDRIFLQRYALATLYYSTGGDQWKSSELWLTDATECNWVSSTCDEEGYIMEISLANNNLRGTVPPELDLLSDSLCKYPKTAVCPGFRALSHLQSCNTQRRFNYRKIVLLEISRRRCHPCQSFVSTWAKRNETKRRIDCSPVFVYFFLSRSPTVREPIGRNDSYTAVGINTTE